VNRYFRDFFLLIGDPSAIRFVKSGQAIEKAGLASPVGPNNGEYLSFVNLKGDIIEN